MAWSAEQVGILGAMGFTPYVRLGATAVVEATVVAPDRLALALRRASRGRDVATLLVDFEALRRDPGAKRRLWPQLRAMRRSG